MSSPTQSAPEEPVTDPARRAVQVSCTVDAPPDRVWERLCSRDGTQALLGPGAELRTKGEPWRSDDGTHGVVRSYHPPEQLRVSWHARDDDPAGLVDLHLAPEGGSTRLDLVHERLADGVDADGVRQRWQEALGRLAAVASG